MKQSAYLDVATLFEPHWTGIPNVTAGIASEAIRDDTIEWTFCFGNITIPHDHVRSMLQARSGEGGHEFLMNHVWSKPNIAYQDAARAKALFPHIKTSRRIFGQEAMFIHDLTPLLTPQFHTNDAINHFADRIGDDIASSQRFFCNSQATRNDLITYLKVDPAQASVIRMGIDLDLFDIASALDIHRSTTIEPYIVVLGTLEPRKNGAIVLKYLARDPDLAHRFRIVFVGRDGWLDERRRLLSAIVELGIPEERIVFTGFVSEAEKVNLLLNCRFCVYASMYEGYGLPIAEAVALGKLVVCSDTSSMPEVAPEMCYFFDPTSLDEFSRAITRAEKRSGLIRTPHALAEIAARLQSRRWDACYRDIAAWVKA